MGLLDYIKEQLPMADVHVWSSMKTQSNRHPNGRGAAEFYEYRQRNISVHLDEPETIPIFAHFSHAHILVVTECSFDYVAAVLNPNCVIFSGATVGLLPNHMEGWLRGWDEGKPSFTAQLSTCIARGWPALA